MFLCRNCFTQRWPHGFFFAMSRGPCEGCRKQSDCADVSLGEEPAKIQPAVVDATTGRPKEKL